MTTTISPRDFFERHLIGAVNPRGWSKGDPKPVHAWVILNHVELDLQLDREISGAICLAFELDGHRVTLTADLDRMSIKPIKPKERRNKHQFAIKQYAG